MPRRPSSFYMEEEFFPEDYNDVEMAPSSPSASPEPDVLEFIDVDLGVRVIRPVSPAVDLDDAAYGPGAEALKVPVYILPDPERNNISDEADQLPSGAQAVIQVCCRRSRPGSKTDSVDLGTEHRLRSR